MFNLKKILFIYLMAGTLLLCPFSSAWSGKEDINLKIKDQTLSADLKDIPLRPILDKLKKESGIWFNGDEALFEKKVTVQFKNLPLEEGLKRILSHVNYSIVFDSDGQLKGVSIFSKGTSVPTKSKYNAPVIKKATSSPNQTKSEIVTTEKGNKPVLTAAGEEKGSPTPMITHEPTSEEMENFKVIKNAPPPGGPVKTTAEELENFKVIKNAPPPGGRVKTPAEELEQFKIIKNAPPPGS
jgi:hypothetical protein